jgi:flagellar basal-body rod protein FlgC
MDSIDALAISASGLAAQRARLTAVAENLANASTTRTAEGGPYRRRVARIETEAPAFATLLAGQAAPRGVRATIVTEQEPGRRVYLPTHPDADPTGYVEMPNVDPIAEMTDLISATRAYEANVSAIQAHKAMAHKALELGR